MRADSVKLSGSCYELNAEAFSNVRVDGRGGADEVVFFELGDREPSRRGAALEADYDGQNVQLNQFLYYQVQSQLNLDGDQESNAADHVFDSLSTDS